MNRRDFTKGLAAAGLAPALPLPSLAKAAPAAMAAKDPMYFWANFVTRVHNKCSPEMLTRLLKLEPGHSAQLFGQLMADGAVTAPDAFGLSQSTNPLYPEYSRVMGHGGKITKGVNKSSNNNALKETVSEDSDTPNAQDPEEEMSAEQPSDDGILEDAEEDTIETDVDSDAEPGFDDVPEQDQEDKDFTSS